MALRDFFRGGHRDHEHEHERERYPLDPLSRDSWRDEAEARYGARSYRDHDYRDHSDERRDFNDRWENSYSGAGQGRFESDQDRDRNVQRPRGGQTRYGGSTNPFYGERPLMNAGSSYDSSLFGSKHGLPTTPWRPDADNIDFDDLVYGGRSFDGSTNEGMRGRADRSNERGQHSGRGPRGYRRSDERVKEDVCQCLTDDAHIDASNIDVAVSDREVTLTGSVTTRFQKRHAEDLIERLPGVRDVINSLRVVSETQGTQSTTTQSTTRPGGTFR